MTSSGAVSGQIISGQSLLFGPRKSRVIDPKTRRKRRSAQAAQLRKITRERDRQDYIAGFDQGLIDLCQGDGALLAETLRQPAGHGFKGIEKEKIRAIVLSLYQDIWSIARRRDDTIIPLKDHQDLAALLLLSDRCHERGLTGNSVNWSANQLACLYGEIAANDLVRDALQQAAAKIGPLPCLIDGDDFAVHIAGNVFGSERLALCESAKEYQYNPHRVDQFDHSPASATVECAECIATYRTDPTSAELLDPSEWAALLETVNHNNWSENGSLRGMRSTLLADSGLTVEQRSCQVIDHFYNELVPRVNELLAPFTKERIS